jgi:hypothetical protein
MDQMDLEKEFRPRFTIVTESCQLITWELTSGSRTEVLIQPRCSYYALPDHKLFVTGGVIPIKYNLNSKKTAVIDLARDFSVVSKPKMLEFRSSHSLVYFEGFFYALGGAKFGRNMTDCERFDFQRETWEMIPPLKVAFCKGASAVKRSTKCVDLMNLRDYFITNMIVQELNFSSLESKILAVSPRLDYRSSQV